MHNVILIGTHHQNFGNCNSNELLKIFVKIKPEVFFEELPPSKYEDYYINKIDTNLESQAIRDYKENNQISQKLIDIEDVTSDEFIINYDNSIKWVAAQIDNNGFDFKNYRSEYRLKMYDEGFGFLNGKDFDYIFTMMDLCIETGIQNSNNNIFIETYELWKKLNDSRETTMLQNIYHYSQENPYERAVFTLGAAHRKSIIQKIEQFQETESIKLNWTYYSEL